MADVTAMKWFFLRGSTYNSLNDSLYSGPAPTITTVMTTTPTAGYIKNSPAPVALSGTDVRGAFTWAGASDFAIGTVTPDTNYVLPLSRYPNTYASGQGNWAVHFTTNSQYLEIRFKYISTATKYRLHINGRKVTDLMQSVNGTTAGSGHMLKVDFGTSEMRDIRIDLTTFPFGGIYIPPGSSIWSYPVSGRGRLMGYGDSLTDGSSLNTGAGMGTWLMRVGRLLDIHDVWEQGRGGTGYITPGSFVPFGDRLDSDLISRKPNKLIVWGGYNDSTGSQPAIKTAVDNVLGRIKSGLPLCRTLVIGCWCPIASATAAISNTDNTIRDSAISLGFPFVSPVTGNVYDESGNMIDAQSPWITSGNVASFIGTDNVHPTDAGHEYLSRRIVAAMRTTGIGII